MPENDSTVTHELSVQEKIVAALRRLPIKDPQRNDVIPWSNSIPGIARQVMLMCKPDPLRGERKKASKELERTREQCRRLLLILQRQLPEDGQPRPIIPIWTLLRTQGAFSAIRLRDALAEFIETSGPDDRWQRSDALAPWRKPEGMAIARYLAVEFERLTGQRPTRIVRSGKPAGPFFQLVKEVFDALEIQRPRSSKENEERIRAGRAGGVSAENAVKMIMEELNPKLVANSIRRI